jgi:WD40 repeat protein
LAFSEDESLLVSAGSDGLIKFWDWENGTAVSSQKTESEGIVHLTVLPGGDVVTIDLSGTVERRNTAGVASTFEVGALNCAAIGSAEKWLVVAGEEPALRLWNLTTQSLVAELEGTLRRATLAVALSPDGLWAVSGGLDQKVVLWNLKKREEAAVWEGHESWVQGVAFSADGRRILSGGKDTTVRLWQVPDGKRLAEFTDPEKSILCVALSPQAPIGISGGVDKLLYAWRWPDGVGN